eukprot:TRINITY_DN10114_c1_g1_i1.p1 TRINITY_DN10114_c1_g1~~TRINITY_DN10114_c1_g1_i1.p1  ORF type:complete len:132 (+),score=43.63 TRINITY_DN10114_c1_g1_i1:23-397(+)
MLLALLNKEYDTQCLFPHSMVNEAGLQFYAYIVDYVSHPKLTDGAFIYNLAAQKAEAVQDEWMYQLEIAAKSDPFVTHNDQWKAFIRTGSFSLDATQLIGKLLQLKNDDVSGQYCCTCPSLALF